jgi:hypothetical protein
MSLSVFVTTIRPTLVIAHSVCPVVSGMLRTTARSVPIRCFFYQNSATIIDDCIPSICMAICIHQINRKVILCFVEIEMESSA